MFGKINKKTTRRVVSLRQRLVRFNSNLPSSNNDKEAIPKAAPAPLTNAAKGRLNNSDKNYENYVAPTKPFTKVEYDIPPPSKPSDIHQENVLARNKPWKKYIPSLVVIGGGIWLLVAYKYFFAEDEELEFLNPDKFTTWILTYRYELPNAPDHFVIELTKKNLTKIHNQMKANYSSMWDGHKLWSVEICQPEINVVRSYTPIPVYVASINADTKEPYLKIIETQEEEGKMLLYLKKYEQGEMAKWLFNRPIGSELLLRGPYKDLILPYSPIQEEKQRQTLNNIPSRIRPEPKYDSSLPRPDNLVFYVAGTCITPVLQMLYSQNPPRGFVDVYYSLEKKSELLKNFEDFNFILEKLGRAKFHYLVGENKQRLTSKDILEPADFNYKGYKSMEVVKEYERKQLLKAKIAELENKRLQDSSINIKEIESSLAKDLEAEEIYLHNDKLYEPFKYKSQVEQFANIKDKLLYKNPAFAIVCGPEGYVNYVSGPRDINNTENKDVAPIAGLLGEKNWTRKNVARMT
ncbi:hypothetical protein PACTADRAFT_4688 [Pachysolen tannophilus NRRL Y-2460]|uniref:FAD-binding FR-type domain-containing protein n=1 Tax=Pachysolen tannophilus NRRL Y-2460 TaxID=669874 RepID=A0A1E4TPW6_PACTA|nr:hypothetical protein PACTADRAFT_4688 [Pachysolen tannophilus NRRL Y-2460]